LPKCKHSSVVALLWIGKTGIIPSTCESINKYYSLVLCSWPSPLMTKEFVPRVRENSFNSHSTADRVQIEVELLIDC
ncbi:MAG: hypothetical protein ACYT04_86135, partial [Nostoc sp.]